MKTINESTQLKEGQLPSKEIKRLIKRGSDALKPYYKNDPDWDAAVTDLLANVRHYCHANGLDFERGIRTSEANFNAEIHGEEGDRNGSDDVGYFAKQGFDIIDQVAGILANRDCATLDDVESAIENKFGADSFYDRFIGPMIDEAEEALGFDDEEDEE